jgi:hypothetical protein
MSGDSGQPRQEGLPMLRMVLYVSIGLGWNSALCLGQRDTASSAASPSTAATVLAQAFPVVMEQNVVAGKAAVGSKIKAKLVAGTLVNGTVIPRNAVFSGEVLESQAKTSSAPSRLSIRLDSAEWKNGSIPTQLYLTQWYYQVTFEAGPDLQHGAEQASSKTWNGMGQYPAPNSPAYEPFPADSGKGSPADSPSPVNSNLPRAMKDVEFQRNSDGGITLVSKRSNLKLDKLTIYVFSGNDAPPGGAK